MCGISLKDRKHSVELYSLLGTQCVADVVRHGKLTWFGHLKCKRLRMMMIGWVSTSRNMEVVAGGGGR